MELKLGVTESKLKEYLRIFENAGYIKIEGDEIIPIATIEE